MSDTEYDPCGNSNSSLYGVADILNLLFFVSAFYVSPCVINTKIWQWNNLFTSS